MRDPSLEPKGKNSTSTGYSGKRYSNPKDRGGSVPLTIEGKGKLTTGYDKRKAKVENRKNQGPDVGTIVDRGYSYDKRNVPEPKRARDGVNQNLRTG